MEGILRQVLCPIFINEILRSWEFTDRYSPTIMGVWRLKEYIDNERSTITMMVWRSCSIIHEIPDLWESHDHSIPKRTRISRSWQFDDHESSTMMAIQRSCKSDDHCSCFMGSSKFIFMWFNRCCWSGIDLNLFNRKILSKCWI